VVTVLVFYLYGCFNEQSASALHTFAQLFERLALPFTTEKGTYLGSTFHTCSIFNGRRASNSGSRTSYEDGVKASSSSAEHLEKSRKIDVNWELEKCGIFTTCSRPRSLIPSCIVSKTMLLLKVPLLLPVGCPESILLK